MKNMIERIGRASLAQPPLRRTDLKNITPIWVGSVVTETGEEERVWLRKLPAPELLAECYSTVLGRSHGLPIPKPFLVSDPRGLIQSPGDLPLFGSLDAEHPSLRQRIENAAEHSIMTDLLKWPALRPCGCFDEQMGNPDRNLGNLLFDGENEWVAIDHAHALGGPGRWPNRPLSPAEQVVNQILNQLLMEAPELEGKRLPISAGYHATQWADTAWGEVLDAETVALIDPNHLFKDVVSFMEKRLPLLTQLVQARVQLHSPQQTLKL